MMDKTTTQTGRFDYVKYDDKSTTDQANLKSYCADLESAISNLIDCPRSKSLALTKLEECYMWIGKGIRNDQASRNAAFELQEQRTNN
jgi:hypothetical protein